MSDASQDTAISAIDAFIAEQNINKTTEGWKTELSKPPCVEFDSASEYYWDIETNIGNISIKLMPDVAPMHVSSTIYLARLGFYDDVVFHRVIDGFMAQGGDPLGLGTGGPGYKYAGEFHESARHDRHRQPARRGRHRRTDAAVVRHPARRARALLASAAGDRAA